MSRANHTFRAMGTDVSLTGPDDPSFTQAAEAVEAVFAREEHRFSRFREDSELSRVNQAAGRWTSVSAPFEALIGIALTQAERTDGLFDPTVLHAMVAAGYDRDFDEVLAGARGALHPPQPCGRWHEIVMRPGEILLPAGVGLDLGGIAKGWTSDLAAEAAVREGLPWSLVSAGGDMRIVGQAPPIDVRIEDPGAPSETAATLRLGSGRAREFVDPATRVGSRPASHPRPADGSADRLSHRAVDGVGLDVRGSRGVGDVGAAHGHRRDGHRALRARLPRRRPDLNFEAEAA